MPSTRLSDARMGLNNKPHVRYVGTGMGWACSGQMITVCGRTPAAAYDKWTLTFKLCFRT